MKSSHQIILLLSYCIFGTVLAMEKEIVPTQECKWFINIDNKSVAKINDFAHGYIVHYDADHKARHLCDDTISFPVEYTDPLPIEYYGDKRFFTTFGDGMVPLGDRGDVLTILDSAIKQLVVVHGAAEYNFHDDRIVDRVHVYLGLETDKAILLPEKCEKIYPAKVMSLQLEREFQGYKNHSQVKFEIKRVNHFDDEYMLEEAKRQFPEIGNRDWDDILVRSLMKRLLGKNARHFNFEYRVFTQSYWDKKNALKEIAYSSEDSKK